MTNETLDWASKNVLLRVQIIMLLHVHLLAPFLKHFISSLIGIKFERMQIHFFVKFLLLLLSLLLLKSSQLTNWLDWLADVLMFMLGKESRLLIANEWSIFHFRSDVSSRCPKTSTARILSLYFSTVSAIHRFVIQLLSEPQKLNLCS